MAFAKVNRERDYILDSHGLNAMNRGGNQMTKEVKCFEIVQRQLIYTSASLTSIKEIWIEHCYLLEYNAESLT